MMFASAEAFQDIVVRLSVLRYVITANTRRGKHDIAIDAEDFFAGFFNLVCGYELVNLNHECPNHPAIDLGDATRRIAVQVTAQNSSAKIIDTLDTFHEHGLDASYNRLIILILSRRPQYTTDFGPYKRTLEQFLIWDIDDLLGKVENELQMEKLVPRKVSLADQLDAYTRRELPSIVRGLSLDPDARANGLLAELAVVSGHPPLAARRFIDNLHPAGEYEVTQALAELQALYTRLKDENYTGTRQILAHALQHAQPAKQFKCRVPEYPGLLSDDTLVFFPGATAGTLPLARRADFWTGVNSLCVSGWASGLEDHRYLSIHCQSAAVDGNLFFYLKQFLDNDLQRLRALLVDLDFRQLE